MACAGLTTVGTKHHQATNLCCPLGLGSGFWVTGHQGVPCLWCELESCTGIQA